MSIHGIKPDSNEFSLVHQNNNRTFDLIENDSYYCNYRYPLDFFIDATAHGVGVDYGVNTTTSITYVLFPTANNSSFIRTNVRIPRFWINGTIRYFLYYSGDANSVGQLIAFRLAGRKFRKNDAVGTAIGSPLATFTAPTTAYELKIAEHANAFHVIDNSYRMISIAIRREPAAGDTYAGGAILYAVRVQYIPSAMTHSAQWVNDLREKYLP